MVRCIHFLFDLWSVLSECSRFFIAFQKQLATSELLEGAKMKVLALASQEWEVRMPALDWGAGPIWSILSMWRIISIFSQIQVTIVHHGNWFKFISSTRILLCSQLHFMSLSLQLLGWRLWSQQGWRSGPVSVVIWSSLTAPPPPWYFTPSRSPASAAPAAPARWGN